MLAAPLVALLGVNLGLAATSVLCTAIGGLLVVGCCWISASHCGWPWWAR